MTLKASRSILLRQWAAGLALWTGFGILWATPSMLGVDPGPDGRGLWKAADHVIVFYWAWALITPLVFLVPRQVVRLHGSRLRMVALTVVAAPGIILLQALLYQGLMLVMGVASAVSFADLMYQLWRHAGGDVATYLTLVGGYLLLDADRRARRNELAAAELLRWQLQPHFVFNALNSVSTLVLKDEREAALTAIARIARYLRDALATRPDAMITLEEELQAVQRYVEIERLRFGDALRVTTDASGEALEARLPSSLLQPLVENAIRHGLAPAGGGGVITISARIEARRLRVSVSDPGSVPGEREGVDGFGLRYVKERIRQRYGSRASLLLSITAAGSMASLELPLVST